MNIGSVHVNLLKRMNIFERWNPRKRKSSREDCAEIFKTKYERFKELLESNAELSKIIADLEERLHGERFVDMSYIRSQSARAAFHTIRMVTGLNSLSGEKYPSLYEVLAGINEKIKIEMERKEGTPLKEWVLPYSAITKEMTNRVGGKNANLGEVLNRVSLPVPEGFAITTQAFDSFLAVNDLSDEIDKAKMILDPQNIETINEVSEEIQHLIISAKVPPELREAILSAYDEMVERIGSRDSDALPINVSMRSSAIGEDSELSFAGQYLSLLNVPRERIVRTYKYVVASLYTPRAISYRLSKGIRDEDVSMSVACVQMIDAVASGVAYSRHPFNPAEDKVIINAVWGLGPYAVDGIITPDAYTVARGEGNAVLEVRTSHKPSRLVNNPEGGLMDIPVPEEKRDVPCLSPEQTRLLASHVLRLEGHYGVPQDVEWALTAEGRILILQTRPLRVEAPAPECPETALPDLSRNPLLIENAAVAFPGIGFGKAFQVHNEHDLMAFPEGGVLVAKHSSPKFVIVMPKAQAIIADSGSVTGHMASLSREFGVPTILGARVAVSSIPTGTEITVDAFSGRVYLGRVDELLELRTRRPSRLKDTAIHQTLNQVCSLITPLHLTDPKAPSFSPESCRSLHDVMRYVHEHSYAEMFQISDLVSGVGGCAIKLSAPLPLDLAVIDLGGGLQGIREHARSATVENVASIPFKALLRGMLHEDLRYHNPRPIELRGFFSVMSEQMLSPGHAGGERFGDRSYAIVSDKYLNFSSRVGYHYGVLDSYCGHTASKNYITFSFKGGAADEVRRNRRARAIGLILKNHDFSVEAVGDRVDARLQKYDLPVIEEKLDVIGRLLLFTRQMDMLMHSEISVDAIAQCFMNGDYRLEGFATAMRKS